MVILTQADLWDVDDADSGVTHVSDYRPSVDKIAEATKAYGMPALMVVGDSHTDRSDNPLTSGAPCVVKVEGSTEVVACNDLRGLAQVGARKNPNAAFDVHPQKQPVRNFHRIVVHGEALPLEWLQLRIDPNSNTAPAAQAFGPFSWKRVRPAM